jgi:hypothetical protein
VKKLLVAAAFASFASLLLAACGKRAGGSCKAGESMCIEKEKALTCQGGKLVEVQCAGPLACTKLGEHANCDDSVSTEGDHCMAEEEYACMPDKKKALVCKGGVFQRYLECRGKAGCSLLGRTVSCDTSVAEKDDPCKTQGAVACTSDQQHMVVCRDGKFILHRYCRGQFGCQTKSDAPTCDETLSLEQDPCGLPGQVVCSVDKTSELVCQGGIFVRSRSCKKTGCVVTSRPGRPIECN